jgi:hypothetical protein
VFLFLSLYGDRPFGRQWHARVQVDPLFGTLGSVTKQMTGGPGGVSNISKFGLIFDPPSFVSPPSPGLLSLDPLRIITARIDGRWRENGC